MLELEEEGGPTAREKRYRTNQKMLVKGMRDLGFETVLPENCHSPIITGFVSPTDESYSFISFYQTIKKEGFVIYPGKVTNLESFRIGNIGDVHPQDIERLLGVIKNSITWQ
jgi:2-aminoethylphosphonate-pyruvate transaminase